jgi:5-methylthioribose kinase
MSSGFILTRETLPLYLRERNLAGDSELLRVRELGGGVSNTVLHVEGDGIPDPGWVVKQSLSKLRGKGDWRSDRHRIFREADAIKALRPILGESAVPDIIHVDRDYWLYIMTSAPSGSVPWKELLLGRRADVSLARKAALLLAQIINASEDDPQLPRRFSNQRVFEQLRIDPYYRTVAARHPDVQDELHRLIVDTTNIRTALAHGDYSPKNMLVHGDHIFLIDFEVVHWGDPSFDAAFLLNHLFLKAFHLGTGGDDSLIAAAAAFWKALLVALGHEGHRDFEAMAFRHLGALLLARIDGKSPVEYIRDEPTKSRVRRAAKRIIREGPRNFEDVSTIVIAENSPDISTLSLEPPSREM